LKNDGKICYGVQKLASTALRERGSSLTDKTLASIILSKAPLDEDTKEKMGNLAKSILYNPKRYTVKTKRMAGYVLAIANRASKIVKE
jgi:hypothetical protein